MVSNLHGETAWMILHGDEAMASRTVNALALYQASDTCERPNIIHYDPMKRFNHVHYSLKMIVVKYGRIYNCRTLKQLA